MAMKKILSSDLIWMFYEKLKEYDDHPFHGVALAIVRGDNGGWSVVTPQRLPKRQPDMKIRISAIEQQLQKQYTLAAE